MKELRKIQANADNSILVVIDMQKGQVSKTYWSDVEPNPEKSTSTAIIPTVRRLVDQAHEARVPVISVYSVRNHRGPEYTLFQYTPGLGVGSQESEFFDELMPEPQDTIVRKWCYNPWHETDLERVVEELVPNPATCQVLITGGSISGCAFYGTLGFYVRGYQAVIVLDAVYGPPTVAGNYFSRTSYPTYPNIFLTRSDMVQFSKVPELASAAS